MNILGEKAQSEWIVRYACPPLFLVGAMKVEPGLDLGVLPEAVFAFHLLESVRTGIAPAAFLHETVPDIDFLVTRTATMPEAPFEDFLIVAAFGDPFCEGGIVNVQETGASGIKPTPLGSSHVVSGRQLAGGLQPDFIDHPAEENDPANFVV
jgi:hypothetical protein